MSPPTAVTIGNFDGVHAGHRALIARCRQHAGPKSQTGGRVVVLAFDPHPAANLPGREPPACLTTFDRRAELLRDAGADDVRRLDPDASLLALTPEQFLDHVSREFAPKVIVEGNDFRFGKGRAGTIDGLRTIGTALGFKVDIVGPVEIALTDHTVVRASSTTARWLIENGRIADAAQILGRPHAITGTVVRGEQLGRTIGFPTINVDTDIALPADGVYAAHAHLPNEAVLPAAVNVGTRPTVNGLARRFEAHLLGLPTSLGGAWAHLPDLPEYGWPIRVEPIAWIRDQVRFPSIHALKDQLARDCARVTGLIETFDTVRTNDLPQETPA
ncbi:MAG: bifunctional riboflavin kinase/FMN adenylyltransferase [Planctomycetota bacterium]